MNLPAHNNLLLQSFPSLRRTACPYCGVGCGVDAKVDFSLDDSGKACSKLLQVSGTPEHPANYGRLCVKGSKLVETNGQEGRLLRPMIRGQQASWDEAIAAVATGFSQSIDQYGPDSVAFYVSGQLLTEDYYVANKLMKGYIGSGNIDTNSRLCMSSAVAGYKRAFGADAVPCSYEDLEQAQLLVLVGSNAAWTHPVLFQRIERAKQLNPAMKIVVVDPRRTASCEIADLHLAIKPGSDVALFNGLLAYLKQNDGLDWHYIHQYTEGFAASLQSASRWCPERVAEYCDVPLAKLKQFYGWFCQSNNAVSLYSMGVNQSTSGVDKSNAIINCHLATGNIGKPGAGPFSITGQPNAMGGREVGGLANMLAAHMDINNPQHRQQLQAFWQSPTMAQQPGLMALDLIDKIEAGEVKAVWIMATNPLLSLPDRDKVADALKKCELVVVSDCVAKNDTLAFADVVLPATGWSEKNGTVTNSERRISRQRGLLRPPGEARHDWQIICSVANAMGFDGFAYQHAYEIFNEHIALSGYKNQGQRAFDLSGLGQLNLSQYDNFSPIQWPVNQLHPKGCKQLFTDGIFFTPSSKAQFVPLEPKMPTQLTSTRFPMVLNTGRVRDQWHSMTRTGKASELLQHMDKPQLHMHPKDAARRGLQQDALVLVKGHNDSQCILHCHIDEQQRPGEVFAPMHWNRQYGSDCNVNCVMRAVADPISGQPELKHAAVSIEPVSFDSYFLVSSRNDIAAERLTAMSDYWLKLPFAGGVCILFGLKEAPEDGWQWLAQLFDTDSASISINAPSQSGWLLQTIGESASQLNAIAWQSAELPSLELPWYSHLMQQDQLSEGELVKALQYQPDPKFDQGRTVCSCFQVAEKTIKQAIVDGCHSVAALGDKLQCGTNCGSCKPELSALIQAQKTATQQHQTSGELV